MKQKSPTGSASRKALGRGLGALLPSKKSAGAGDAPPSPASGDAVRTVPLTLIDANPDQPRQIFSEQSIQELAQSIRADGVIQPILLRPEGDRFLLIAGERRLRATAVAGLTEIPAVVRDIPDDRILEIALIENIQREDLNPLEVARALHRLSIELRLSHEELANRTGKSRATITNQLRLLRLPASVQQMIAGNELQMGHARALLALTEEADQVEVAEQIRRRGLSVRQVEEIVRKKLQPPVELPPPPEPDPNEAAAVENLERVLGTRVRLVRSGKRKGRIEIDFGSEDELERIYSLLADEPA
jgi:ParB family chromosome partitioning protein